MSQTPGSVRRPMARHGLAALGLLAVALTVYLVQVAPLDRENAALEQRLLALRADTTAPVATRLRIADQPRRVGVLPNRLQRDADIAQFALLARKHGLQLGQMGFEENSRLPAEMSPDAPNMLNGRVSVAGSYLSIRTWLNEIVGRMPSLEISTLRLQRAAGAGDELQARLEFVYFSSASLPDKASEALPPVAPRPLPPEAQPTFDPFAGAASGPRPVAPRHAAEPTPAPAATLTVAYGGSYRANGVEVHLLIEGDNVHRLRVGETLPGGEFRLESANRQQLELLHLPSSRRLPLLTGNPAP